MNLTQLLALGGGAILVYSAVKGIKPGEVFRALIAQSKTKGDAPLSAAQTTPVGQAAASAAQWTPGATPVAKFNGE